MMVYAIHSEVANVSYSQQLSVIDVEIWFLVPIQLWYDDVAAVRQRGQFGLDIFHIERDDSLHSDWCL